MRIRPDCILLCKKIINAKVFEKGLDKNGNIHYDNRR